MTAVFSVCVIIICIVWFTAGGHCGGDAGLEERSERLRAEAQRHYNPTRYHW